MRRGGTEVGQLANAGLWGTAYANSDGSVMGTIATRLWYGFLILSPLIVIGVLFMLFGRTTKKEAFGNKDVRKRPMFTSIE
jgi:hypothetical protein